MSQVRRSRRAWSPRAASWALGAAAFLACTTPRPSEPPLESVAPSQPSMLTPMPGPARGRMEAAVRANDGCVACHADVAAEWRGSLHQRANIEPAYQRSFAIEPLPFCRSCHAPEAVSTEEEPEAVSHLGVGCVTCHVTEAEGVLAAPLRSPAAERSPHALTRSATFGSAEACAGCHEFRFPFTRALGKATLMQSTHSEHAESPASGRSCADCHMPARPGGGRSHRFAASRNPDFLRGAALITATRKGVGLVEVTLTPKDPGHAFPTGDLFRRIEVHAEVEGPDRMSLASSVRYLARHWGFKPGHVERLLVSDDRVANEPRTVELELGEQAAGREIVWRVAYQRVAHPKGIDEADAEIEGEVVLAAGRLPASE
ncbi:MAG: hypothetical protein IPG04_08715 [Polyangiaceae bacterium]|jgi:nitrate/TMAO reductase-like tetraheme cytochrome c subunit|nr:hypothetical protein [Polyangiaceae bacterium]